MIIYDNTFIITIIKKFGSLRLVLVGSILFWLK